MLNPVYNVSFEELYHKCGLEKIDAIFLQKLQNYDKNIYENVQNARKNSLKKVQNSEILIKLAPFVDLFFADLFQLQDKIKGLKKNHEDYKFIFECKKNFIQRYVAKQLNFHNEEILAKIEDAKKTLKTHNFDFQSELAMAKSILQWQLEENKSDLLYAASIYSAYMMNFTDNKNSILFNLPKKLDYDNLIEVNSHAGVYNTQSELRNRKGFELNDAGVNSQKSIDQAKYCIHCHKQEKDYCSQGMIDKNTTQSVKNHLGVKLDGCPLDQKISEMNYLKAHGFFFSPLAVAMIDNPMLAATGHRICNDCMKSCIFQKQEPVNIPFIETEVLQTILDLPYGFEIYSLLIKWNPMNFLRWLPAAQKNDKVLVVGLGPAGFTLSHYLLNEGVNVVAIDGLKIEPSSSELSGIDQNGIRSQFKPIKNIKDIYDNLDQRTAFGFGGVAEYGITNRWDKNYLKIIRLILERRDNFRMYGNIRFGSNITYVQAKNLGFDHIALALGAGSPHLPNIKNLLAKGVKTASDFLMSLHLSGATRYNSLDNLQLELPIVVIGGGLTAVDAATESLNYYARQVEKFLIRYEFFGDSFFNKLNSDEQKLAQKFLKHAYLLRDYPERKAQLLQTWGGVKILYRKSIQESPSYRLNHEELEKALEEGVQFFENITPESIEIDSSENCTGIKHKSGFIEARTILLATGTKPNVILSKEDRENFQIENAYFKLSTDDDYSIFGDLDPRYHGNVVKAMASAKNGYLSIIEKLNQKKTKSIPNFFLQLDKLFLTRIVKINRLTSNIVEILLQSKLAATNFQPGQFYRLQNYEYNAIKMQGYKRAIEPLALTGTSVNKSKGLLSMIVLEMGGSSNFCTDLKPGEIVALMGPTGSPTFIPKKKKVMLIGGGLGNAVLFSIGRAMRKNDCEVLYFAGYKKIQDRYKVSEIEKAANVIVWCCEEGILSTTRKQDISLKANILDAISEYSRYENTKIKLYDIDHIIVIGSDQMMSAVAYARHNNLSKFFKNNLIEICSVNSPMQCMMKEVCGQCLQRNIDANGQEYYVYSCFQQDQKLREVDFNCLKNRLSQNSLMEKTTSNIIAQLTKSL